MDSFLFPTSFRSSLLVVQQFINGLTFFPPKSLRNAVVLYVVWLAQRARTVFNLKHNQVVLVTVIAPIVSMPAVASRSPKKSFSSIFNLRHWIALLSPSESILKKKGNKVLLWYGSVRNGRVSDIASLPGDTKYSLS